VIEVIDVLTLSTRVVKLAKLFMKLNDHEFEKLVREYLEARGVNTEGMTIYIPPDAKDGLVSSRYVVIKDDKEKIEEIKKKAQLEFTPRGKNRFVEIADSIAFIISYAVVLGVFELPQWILEKMVEEKLEKEVRQWKG